MSSGTSIDAPINPTTESPANGLQNVIITDPSWYYLQAFAQSCLALPQTATDFTNLYGDFPGTDVSQVVSYFQALNSLATQFGNPAYYTSQGNAYLGAPTAPSDLLGSTMYSISAQNGSVFSAATGLGVNLAYALNQSLNSSLLGPSDDPNYRQLNQQLVYNFLTSTATQWGCQLFLDITTATATTLNGTLNTANTFSTNFTNSMNQNSGMAQVISNMLTYAQQQVSSDISSISQLTTDANALLSKYNTEMAIVDWTRNPGSVVPDLLVLGPFGGGIFFGVSAIIGNLIATDATKVLAEWNSVESTISSLSTDEAQKAAFIRDFMTFNASITQATASVQPLVNNITNIWNAFNSTLGLNVIQNIHDINPAYFDNYADIDNLIDLTLALTDWPNVASMAGNFQCSCMPQGQSGTASA